MLQRITVGRTDLVFDLLAAGRPAMTRDDNGVSLLKRCASHEDVSAVRALLDAGETLQTLGDDLGLHAAAFHGHWQLCQFLVENGADVDRQLADTGESPLHAALREANRKEVDTSRRRYLFGKLCKIAARPLNAGSPWRAPRGQA